MNTDSERLEIHPLFLGLTRPPMYFGVHLNYLCLCGFIAFCGFLLLHSFLPFLIGLPLHFIGWVICKLDPDLFEVIAKRNHFMGVPNKSLHGCQSYAPF